jgi:hypothetical protein
VELAKEKHREKQVQVLDHRKKLKKVCSTLQAFGTMAPSVFGAFTLYVNIECLLTLIAFSLFPLYADSKPM